MSPRVGFSDMKSRRSSVDLPAPDGPVRNWKERGAISEGEVAQHLRTHSISEADILEADQCSVPACTRMRGSSRRSRRPAARAAAAIASDLEDISVNDLRTSHQSWE